MIEIEDKISTLIRSQFPAFYTEESAGLVDFIKAYYEFMEQSGGVLETARNLPEYGDVDTSIDEFIKHFKTVYLNNLPDLAKIDDKQLIKHASDLYESKGSLQSFKLLMRILFNEDADIYLPSRDIFRVSAGKWVKPTYIEVSIKERTKTFIAKEIFGINSGAKGFVESISRKLINGKYIDIIFMSNVRGLFSKDERITDDLTNYDDTPFVIGSLSEITITNGGAGASIGDIFTIESAHGKDASVRVSEIEDGTGKVNFNLNEGGSGYTLTNETEVIVSDFILNYTDTKNNANTNITDFYRFETVRQPLFSMSHGAPSGTISVGDAVNGIVTANSTVVALGYVVNTTAGNTVISDDTSGDWTLVDYLEGPSGNTNLSNTAENISVTANTIGTTANTIGSFNLVGGTNFYANNAYIVGLDSNTTANVSSVSTGSGATFDVGSIVDTETLTLYTDFIKDENSANVEFVDVYLDGSNSGIGFVESVTIDTAGTGYANTDTLTFTGGTPTVTADYTITTDGSGVITSVTGVATGSGYYAEPVITINTAGGTLGALSAVMNYGYGFPKDVNGDQDTYLVDLLYKNNFTIGTIASLSAINPGANYNTDPLVSVFNPYIAGFDRRNLILDVNNVTGTFLDGEEITQDISQDGYDLSIANLSGTFALGEGVQQDTSGATGTVVSSNTTQVSVESIAGIFTVNPSINGLTSGATANTTSNTITQTISFSKGYILSSEAEKITVKRTTFGTSFQDGIQITGALTSATADVINVYSDPDSSPMGDNADVSANVTSAAGIVSAVEVLNSGYGYEDDDVLTLSSPNSAYVITASANVEFTGVGEGYWLYNDSELNSNKKLHDNKYYQEYSYEIVSGLSLEKYASIFTDLVHVAGTELFGRVLKSTEMDAKLTTVGAEAPIIS